MSIEQINTGTQKYGCFNGTKLSRAMRFPTMWYVRPAKAQISLRIRAD